MRLPDLGNLGGTLKNLLTMQKAVEDLEQDFSRVASEVSALRTDTTDLKIRLAVLESRVDQGHNTFEAQMRAVVAETVAVLRIRFVEAQAAARANPTAILPDGDKSD